MNGHFIGRKRIKNEIAKQFPQLTDTDLQNFFPNKESMSAIKIVTHNGDLGMIYSVQKLPLIFELEKMMYPTVYMLWSYPDILPTFTIWPQVFERLAGGADLMLPGIVLKCQMHVKAYGNLSKGASVAINMTNNKAPVAVGTTALSSYDMYMAAQRGKAVKILHTVGDELWSYGMKLTIPHMGPPNGYEQIGGVSESLLPVNELSSVSENVSEVENKCDVNVICQSVSDLEMNSKTDDITTDLSVHQEGEVLETDAPSQEEMGVGEQTESEVMDKLLLYCFLKACRNSTKKVEFPLLTSNFYKLHIIPACPPDSKLDIKKSNYKKLSKFLKAMENLDIIQVKEITKGVESIMSINLGHEMLKNFIDPIVPKSDEQKSDISSKAWKPAITELYTVTAAVLPLFSQYGLRKGTNLSIPEVRKYVTDYVKKEKLQDKQMVKINEVLQSAVQDPNTMAVTWEDLMGLIIGRMSRSYEMTFSGEKPTAVKGKLEPIDIQVGKRTGNKKVTLINNLELYGINIQEFARECQHGVAASTSISSVPGKKSSQLLVQGNQVLFVGNLLMGKYQIPKRYVRGLENAPKQKK
ncbi:eukaryotic translation initiation factor 2D isoform X2 [Periplaneta americana]|uniref:eukaryotic translation initiation factor 2D isoform X2 n=1 Tax=Periplaneta americana TaxID=6978 RepID=UPI0037E9546C